MVVRCLQEKSVESALCGFRRLASTCERLLQEGNLVRVNLKWLLLGFLRSGKFGGTLIQDRGSLFEKHQDVYRMRDGWVADAGAAQHAVLPV